jgi:hypothetical protein
LRADHSNGEIFPSSNGGRGYFAGGGAGAAAGAVAAAGAGAEVPEVAGAGALAAAACGCAAGLIQQAWTRPLRLSGTLGSIALKKRTRQRKVAWT